MISISIPSCRGPAKFVSLRNWTAGRRGRQIACRVRDERDKAITCVFCRDLH